MKRLTLATLLPWCLCLALLLFVALKPAWAVQRVDYTQLSSDQLLATDDIRNSPQDVQIIGDRLIVRLSQTSPTGDRYQWQAVFRAVTTFQREATGPHEVITAEAMSAHQDDWRDDTYWRRRWEEHRNQARGMSPDLREQLRALPEAE